MGTRGLEEEGREGNREKERWSGSQAALHHLHNSHETYIGKVWVGGWREVGIGMSRRSIVWRRNPTRLYIKRDTHTCT